MYISIVCFVYFFVLLIFVVNKRYISVGWNLTLCIIPVHRQNWASTTTFSQHIFLKFLWQNHRKTSCGLQMLSFLGDLMSKLGASVGDW